MSRHREMFIDNYAWLAPDRWKNDSAISSFNNRSRFLLYTAYSIRLVHPIPQPPEQQVVLQLFDQHSFAAYRIEDLQQQRFNSRPRNRRTPTSEYSFEISGNLLQNLIDDLADRRKDFCRNTLSEKCN